MDNTVGDDRKSSKSIDAKTSKFGTAKISMGRGFRFGTRAGEAVAA